MLTQEKKKAIYEEYLDSRNKVGDIAAKHHVTRSAVARVAVEMGAPPRNEKRFGKQIGKATNPARICPKCRKRVDVKGARYCCFCGGDIRTGKEIAAERLEKLLGFVVHFPANMRDEAQQTILNAIKELKG